MPHAGPAPARRRFRLSDEHVVGAPDGGFIHMMQKLPQERLGCAISNVAHAAQVLRGTPPYTKDRQAFGAPIGSFQHHNFLLVELFTQVEVAHAHVAVRGRPRVSRIWAGSNAIMKGLIGRDLGL